MVPTRAWKAECLITEDQYVRAVDWQLRIAKAYVSPQQVGPLPALVGHVYQRANLGRQHVCVVAAIVPHVSPNLVTQFAKDVQDLADATTRGVRGLGASVLAVAGLVTRDVHPGARVLAAQAPRSRFGGETRPVVVDVLRGIVDTFTGTKFVGSASQGLFRRQVAWYFPPPAAVQAQIHS